MLKDTSQGGGTADTVDSKSAAFGRESSNLSPGTKTCLQCKEDLPRSAEYFYTRNRRGKQEFAPRCRPCNREFNLQYQRKVRDGTQEPTVKLPIGPFREWILGRMAYYKKAHSHFDIGDGGAEFSRRSGLSERRVNEITKRGKYVTLDLVDRALVMEGSAMLWELYPELYE